MPAPVIVIVVLWVGLAVLVSLEAYRKGGSFIAGFGISLLLSPLIGLLLVAVHSPRKDVLDERAIKKGKAQRCPQCKEVVRADARVCRHCGNRLVSDSAAG